MAILSDSQKACIMEMRGNGASYAQVATVVGVNLNTIKTHCQKHGLGGMVAIRRENRASVSHCAHCNAHIHASKRGRPAVYCGDACRLAAWYLRRRGA